MCARKATRGFGRDSAADRFLWWGLAVVMLILGINKQLELQKSLLRKYFTETDNQC
jgi:hypothetical protein